MTEPQAIINPAPPKGGPPLPPFAAMVGSLPDLSALCGKLGLDKAGFRSFVNSRLYWAGEGAYALAGPMIGAPYAVMLLETLIAWGAERILFMGWCGAISPAVKIGDILVPTGAIIDEGTSRHYGMASEAITRPGPGITDEIQAALTRNAHPYHTGSIWTTDGFFREIPERVVHFQQQQALAVEMELSALFTVGHFRQVEVGAVLVVSDTLADLTWQKGFQEKRFKAQRRAVCEVISQLCLAQ